MRAVLHRPHSVLEAAVQGELNVLSSILEEAESQQDAEPEPAVVESLGQLEVVAESLIEAPVAIKECKQ